MVKKQYIVPDVDITSWNTAELMKVSGTSPDLPDGPGVSHAPRRTSVF